MSWAKPLARALCGQWEFLQRYMDDAADGTSSTREVVREQGLRLRMIAATLGTRLGPDWTAEQVVRLVEQHAGVHSVIAAGEAHSPLRYLAVMLERALTSPDAQAPHTSPVRQAYEHEVLAAELTTAAARTATLRAELDQRDAAAATARAGDQAGLRAARAAAAAAGARRGLPRQSSETAVVSESWPDVRRPGSGHRDR